MIEYLRHHYVKEEYMKPTLLIISSILTIGFCSFTAMVSFQIFLKYQEFEKNKTCPINCDYNNDKICDLNCDTDNDGYLDRYVDTNNDKVCDLYCD